MSPSEPQRSFVFQCAWQYYVEGVKQAEIAERLSISRATVALYLRKARETGVVRISMDATYFADRFLALSLTAGLSIDTAYVIPANGSAALADVAAAAWHVLEPKLAKTRRLGVAWGETVYALAEVLPRVHYPKLDVLQLCGNLAGSPNGTLPDTSTFRIARQLGAEPHNLYAPLILSSPEIASVMMNEAVISEHFKALITCDIAVFSPGVCEPDSHIVTSGAISRSELERYREEGARAVVCGRLIDEDGNGLADFNERVLAIELDTLRKIPTRLLIASGIEKAAAVAAAIRGHFVTHLVIDETIARYLVESFALELPASAPKIAHR